MLKFFFVWGSKKILSDICRINTSEPLKFDVILFLVGWQVSALPLNLNMAYIIPWAGREFYCMDRPVIHRTELENSSLEAPGITTECSNFWKFESSSFKQGDLPHAMKYECKKAFSYYKENFLRANFCYEIFLSHPLSAYSAWALFLSAYPFLIQMSPQPPQWSFKVGMWKPIL